MLKNSGFIAYETASSYDVLMSVDHKHLPHLIRQGPRHGGGTRAY